MSRTSVIVVLSGSLAACSGGGGATLTAAAPRPPCGAGTIWDGETCRPHAGAAAIVAEAQALRKQLQLEDEIALLERALEGGPYHLAELADLHAELGIAFGYLERDADALRELATVLRIDRSYVISYEITPKVAELFEAARVAARAQTPPELDVSWPRDLEVSRPVPVDIGVFSDAEGRLRSATLHMRRKGTDAVGSFDLPLLPAGKFARVVLPAPETTRPEVLQLWATAHDERGNEVLRWGDATRPREVPLRYDRPTPWYRKWWVWGIAGVAVAGVTGAVVYVTTLEPPDLVGGEVVPP